jgi:hypothetical protein
MDSSGQRKFVDPVFSAGRNDKIIKGKIFFYLDIGRTFSVKEIADTSFVSPNSEIF